jgi:hypothetical protein
MIILFFCYKKEEPLNMCVARVKRLVIIIIVIFRTLMDKKKSFSILFLFLHSLLTKKSRSFLSWNNWITFFFLYKLDNIKLYVTS